MIKKMLTIILLLLSLCSFGQQDGAHNNLKITYELAFQQDSTSGAVKKETMFLFLGPQSSFFQSANQFYKDSLTLRRDKFGEKVQLGKYWSEFMFRIIKSGQKEMVVVDAIGDDLFSYREDPSAIRWDIRNDTATMSGFSCQKAVAVYAGREWIAWFTSEVPSSEGPYKFSGLPGLIVHISDTRQHYVFSLMSIQKYGAALPSLEAVKPIQTSKSNFLKASTRFRSDPFGYSQQRGVQFRSGQDEIKKSMELFVSQRNNPIEL